MALDLALFISLLLFRCFGGFDFRKLRIGPEVEPFFFSRLSESFDWRNESFELAPRMPDWDSMKNDVGKFRSENYCLKRCLHFRVISFKQNRACNRNFENFDGILFGCTRNCLTPVSWRISKPRIGRGNDLLFAWFGVVWEWFSRLRSKCFISSSSVGPLKLISVWDFDLEWPLCDPGWPLWSLSKGSLFTTLSESISDSKQANKKKHEAVVLFTGWALEQVILRISWRISKDFQQV